jgi:pimeloyl-ACP methyl ester carboxylesterase
MITQLRQIRHHVGRNFWFGASKYLPAMPEKCREMGARMFEVVDHKVHLAFIDERPACDDHGEPILLIHGFASTHAVNWVFPQWVKTLTEAGRRFVAFDNRGHGRSEKFHDPAAVLIAAGTKDDVAGNPHELAALFRRARGGYSWPRP